MASGRGDSDAGGSAAAAPGAPEAAGGPCATRRERRLASNREAQRRYKQRVKNSTVTMQQEVLTRSAEVSALLRTNVALRARERVLQRAIEGSGVQLAVISRQLGGDGPSGTDTPELPTPSADGSGGLIGWVGGSGGSTPPERPPHNWLGAPPSPPAAAGCAGTPELSAGAGLADLPDLPDFPSEGAPPLPPLLSNPAAERVLERVRGSEPSLQAVPRELLEAIGDSFRRFVQAHRAAEQCAGPDAEVAHAGALLLFRDAHELVRNANMACLLLRSQLRNINFETMAFDAPPPGHWRRVVAHAGGLEALSPEAQADVVESWRLAGSGMARLRAQQQALLRELAALEEGSAPAEGGVHPQAEERQLRYAELLAELTASCGQDAALANVYGWKLSSVVGAPTLARAVASSWPFWLDAWACTEVIAQLAMERPDGGGV
ncbi:hypothetical protein Rsub_12523 [Raphidocelis subcapitata]|uniref:BZIP domain-containing protein n=1 Tax=Raphidocelis subcapitata TaxID=307507 RepID=A0A2V0PIX1_9CHLO|nr:hypothetical protein Rsub_12523 [Raphidocelis subcapitata]|eukprot:GBF99748.1 hypothetical protein Rsub_12523 [Raphidocelis subcapitata]